jgi:hypothetical protein
VLISNALPVKFWTDPDNSFNNKEVCGVEPICWCQPFECDDEILIQFTDITETEDPEIETIPIPDLPALSTWLTRSISGTRPDWTEGAVPTVDIDGVGFPLGVTSEVIYAEYEFLAGYDYEISLEFDRTIHAGVNNPRTATLRIYDEDFNTIFTETLAAGAGTNIITINFTATEDCAIIGFHFGSGTDVTIDLTDLSGDRTGLEIIEDPGPRSYELSITDSDDSEITSIPFEALSLGSYNYLYSLSFIPNDEEICNQQIKLKIVDTDASPDEVVASTDCLDIRTTQTCTLQIAYTNSKNFNNLIYDDVSPEIIFYIRIPAIFFEEDNPAEQEDHELSSGEIVRLYNKLEKRKKLDIGFLPPYMHEKIQLILMHDSITIDDAEWIRREVYEKIEGNKRYPLKRAMVYLHDKNFIKENQL